MKYDSTYVQIYERLKNLLDCSYFENLKLQRDKEFGHSDKHEVNEPYKVKPLTPAEITIGFVYLNIIKDSLNDMSVFLFGKTYKLNKDSRTANFIMDFEEYRKFYFDNDGHFNNLK